MFYPSYLFLVVLDNSLNEASKLPASHKGKALVLYFGFHDISKNVVNDGSGRNNNARLTKGIEKR